MEELNWPVACHLNVASSLILPGGRKPDQQRSFILTVWKLARRPLLFTCVCVCVCVLLGEGPERAFGSPCHSVLGHCVCPFAAREEPQPPGHASAVLPCGREVISFSSVKETSLSERDPWRIAKPFLLTSVIRNGIMIVFFFFFFLLFSSSNK